MVPEKDEVWTRGLSMETGGGGMGAGGKGGFLRIVGCRANRAWWLTGDGEEREREKEKQNLVLVGVSPYLLLLRPPPVGETSTYLLISNTCSSRGIRIPSFWRDSMLPE